MYIEIYTLIEGKIQSNKIDIPSCIDLHGINLIKQKIKEIESLYKIPDTLLSVAPLCNYLKYEINSYISYINIFVERAIESVVIKMKLIEKNNNANQNANLLNKKDDKNDLYSGFYTKKELNIISKNYYERYNLEEILDDFKLNIINKNIKIDITPNKKIKMELFLVSDSKTKSIILEFYKGINIKKKYIEIINNLREENIELKDEISEKNAIIELKNKEIKNNIYNHINNNVFLGNDILKKKEIFDYDINNEKKLLNKKRKKNENKKNNIKNNKNDKKEITEIRAIMQKAIKEAKNKNKINVGTQENKNNDVNVHYNLRKIDVIEEKEEISVDDDSEKFITIEEDN